MGRSRGGLLALRASGPVAAMSPADRLANLLGTGAGTGLNSARFAGFDEVHCTNFHGLGLALALSLRSSDL